MGLVEEKLSIEVTTHCNIACTHCFARAGNADGYSLSIELAKEIIAEGYGAGYRRLHITGGEPLLWEGLFDVLDYSLDIGYRTVFMNTNGTLLTEKIASRLAACRDLWISVSVDGSEALHNHLRGEGSYKRAIEGLIKAHDAGVDLFIFSIACRSLVAELPHFARAVYGRFPNIKSLTLIPLISLQDDSFGLSKERLTPDNFLSLLQTAALLNMGGFRTDFLNEPLANVASKRLGMPWLPRGHPPYREGSMIVMANREIRLSHSSGESFGRYQPGMIEKVLSSRHYRKKTASDESTCVLCNYLELCRENHMIRPSEAHRGIDSHSPYCRQVLERIA